MTTHATGAGVVSGVWWWVIGVYIGGPLLVVVIGEVLQVITVRSWFRKFGEPMEKWRRRRLRAAFWHGVLHPFGPFPRRPQ